jgi:hypothetical protein
MSSELAEKIESRAILENRNFSNMAETILLKILNETTVKRSDLIDFLVFIINENLIVKPSTYEDIVNEYEKSINTAKRN